MSLDENCVPLESPASWRRPSERRPSGKTSEIQRDSKLRLRFNPQPLLARKWCRHSLQVSRDSFQAAPSCLPPACRGRDADRCRLGREELWYASPESSRNPTTQCQCSSADTKTELSSNTPPGRNLLGEQDCPRPRDRKGNKDYKESLRTG